MNRLGLTFLTLLAGLLIGIPAARALTTEEGTAIPGEHANATDPDQQVPGYLKPPEDQQHPPAPSNPFNVGGAPGMPMLRGNITAGPTPIQHPIFSDQFNSDR
jgi:hypothetical protein